MLHACYPCVWPPCLAVSVLSLFPVLLFQESPPTQDRHKVGLTRNRNKNYPEINVAAQNSDPNSVLNHFRKMAKLRKENSVLVYGEYELLEKEHPEIYVYTRTLGEEKMLVLLNFSKEEATISLTEIGAIQASMINNYDTCEIEDNTARLMPYQAVVFSVN